MGWLSRPFSRQKRYTSDADLDTSDLPNSLTLPKISRAFSPDGSGMLEMFWLPSMEAARQHPLLLAAVPAAKFLASPRVSDTGVRPLR